MLVGVAIFGEDQLLTMEESLDELALLATTAGIRVVARQSQRLTTAHPGTLVGSGKVEELAALVRDQDADVVIFDEELSPAQLRNLERELDCKVLDRTALILDIFAMHASTREGALQVELAQYAYRLPRLTRLQRTHLSRQAVGGVGLRGPAGDPARDGPSRHWSPHDQGREELEEVRMHRSLQPGGDAPIGMPGGGHRRLYQRPASRRCSTAWPARHWWPTSSCHAGSRPRGGWPSSGKKALVTDFDQVHQKLPTDLVAASRHLGKVGGRSAVARHGRERPSLLAQDRGRYATCWTRSGPLASRWCWR